MKTVYLLRHAKSKQDPSYETDFERPLAKRGKSDADDLGVWLRENDLTPDLIISSPAKRARQTIEHCVEAGDLMCEVRYTQSLYANGEQAYLEAVVALDDTVGSVMLVGHNPDISLAVEWLSGAYHRMPTCALARVDLPIVQWSQLETKTGALIQVRVPEE
ncbi:MAG: histidine phosphatase family protein [Anaerolineae bacterium]|nr:histidine phosphatase family protein [Anaerolineae bacterium]